MSKHTPGPWTYHMNENYARIYLRGSGRIYPALGGDSLQGYCGEANARLIAAAPDLLEACKVALGIIGFGAEHDQISAAIAKATGEQL